MTVIYVTLFLTGVVGNVATGVVIVRNRSMHTATNYYLFSLALSDLVILLLGELDLSCRVDMSGTLASDLDGLDRDLATKSMLSPSGTSGVRFGMSHLLEDLDLT